MNCNAWQEPFTHFSTATFLCLFLLFCLSPAAIANQPLRTRDPANLDRAFSGLDQKAAVQRRYDGWASLTSGALTFIAGSAASRDNFTGIERLLGFTGATLGLISFVDGFYLLLSKSSTELIVPHFQSYPSKGKPTSYGGTKDKYTYGKNILERLAFQSRKSRVLRAVRDYYITLHYLFYFIRGLSLDTNTRGGTKQKYERLFIPAAILSCVTIARFIFPTPEEAALIEFKSGKRATSRIDFMLDPFNRSAAVSFRF